MVEVNNVIDAIGTVHLILCDGATLKANWDVNIWKIDAQNPGNLTIYAQSTGDGMGQLIANESLQSDTAGIYVSADEAATLTINGGMITANGVNSDAGIGGSSRASCGTVTINGGTVIAQGSGGAPAIGAGLSTGDPDHGTLKLVPQANNAVYIAKDENDSVIDAF